MSTNLREIGGSKNEFNEVENIILIDDGIKNPNESLSIWIDDMSKNSHLYTYSCFEDFYFASDYDYDINDIDLIVLDRFIHRQDNLYSYFLESIKIELKYSGKVFLLSSAIIKDPYSVTQKGFDGYFYKNNIVEINKIYNSINN